MVIVGSKCGLGWFLTENKQHFFTQNLPPNTEIYVFGTEAPPAIDLASLLSLFYQRKIHDFNQIDRFFDFIEYRRIEKKILSCLKVNCLLGLTPNLLDIPDIWSFLAQRNLVLAQIYHNLSQERDFNCHKKFYVEFLQELVLPFLAQVKQNKIKLNLKQDFDSPCLTTFRRQVDSDSFLEVDFNIFNTVTGRISGPHKIFSLPKDHNRKVIVSRFGSEGKILMYDFTAMEIVRAFHLAKIKVPLADIYGYFTTELFQENLTPETRKINKILTILWFYAEDPVKALESKNWPNFDHNKTKIKILQKSFPTLTLFKKSILDKARRLGYLDTSYQKRIRIDPNISENITFNYEIQSSAACFALEKYTAIQAFLKTGNWRSKIILPWHDALIFDFKLGEEKLMKIIPMILEYPVKGYLGDNLYDLTPIIIPDFAQEKVPF